MALGSVQGALGESALLGGLVMSVWGGPRRKIHGALWPYLRFLWRFFVCHRPYLARLDCRRSGFVLLLHSAADWLKPGKSGQVKVPPDVQGRFCCARRIANGHDPAGYLFAGPLADKLFEPAMLPGGMGGYVWLAGGHWARHGYGVDVCGTAVFGCLMSLSGYLIADACAR
ncbi:MAG: hypothetical protein R3E31_16300 [Chloroflexota bacterium]